MHISSRSEGRRPERSKVNKFVGPSRAKPREFKRKIYLYICMYVYLYIYFVEGVRTGA